MRQNSRYMRKIIITRTPVGWDVSDGAWVSQSFKKWEKVIEYINALGRR